jgi:CcmD family protein
MKLPNTLFRILAGWLAGLLACLLSIVAPLAALAADQYEPLNEASRQRMDPNPYILAAYGFMWVAVLVYVVMVARGLGRARNEIETLRRRVDTGG